MCLPDVGMSEGHGGYFGKPQHRGVVLEDEGAILAPSPILWLGVATMVGVGEEIPHRAVIYIGCIKGRREGKVGRRLEIPYDSFGRLKGRHRGVCHVLSHPGVGICHVGSCGVHQPPYTPEDAHEELA